MPDPRPNILLLFTDQQRFDTIAALGNDLIRTPSLDRLVRDGVSFDRAYTPSPVCMSARCATATGLYPHQTGCVDNKTSLDPTIPSFIEHLAEAGYQTHGVGKMHFRPESLRPWGFEGRDTSEGGPFANGPGDDYHEFLRARGLADMEDPHGLLSEYYYLPQPSLVPAALHETQWVADRSIDFLRRRDRRRPFFLWSSWLKPHPPFESPSPWNRLYRAVEMPDPTGDPAAETAQLFWNRFQNRYKYRDAGCDAWLVRTMRAAYYASISFVDHAVGQVLAALGSGIDNTLVVFTSDHGEFLGQFGCFGKRSMLDDAARVPLLARWPGRLPAGLRCDRPASLVDLFPTFLRAAEVEPGEAPGENLRDVASGDTPRQAVLSQYEQGPFGLYMLATRHEKYIYSAPDRAELYLDRRVRPDESANLIARPACAARAAELRSQLVEQLRADGADADLDGDGWKPYPAAAFYAGNRDGLLYQDGRDTQQRINALGPDYARATMRHGFAQSEQIFGQ